MVNQRCWESHGQVQSRDSSAHSAALFPTLQLSHAFPEPEGGLGPSTQQTLVLSTQGSCGSRQEGCSSHSREQHWSSSSFSLHFGFLRRKKRLKRTDAMGVSLCFCSQPSLSAQRLTADQYSSTPGPGAMGSRLFHGCLVVPSSLSVSATVFGRHTCLQAGLTLKLSIDRKTTAKANYVSGL